MSLFAGPGKLQELKSLDEHRETRLGTLPFVMWREKNKRYLFLLILYHIASKVKDLEKTEQRREGGESPTDRGSSDTTKPSD